MSLLSRLFERSPGLSKEQRDRLARWQALPEPDPALRVEATRIVVADVESSGLNVITDRLIAIGAVAIVGAKAVIADSFYAVLRQPKPSSPENILLHGIGGTEQAEGSDPVEALLGFLAFAGKAPLVGFNSSFDEIMIGKSMQQLLGEPFRRSWIDLAWLAPSVLPDEAKATRGLDGWLAHFGITVSARHHALADSLATAQLFLVLAARAREMRIATLGAIREAAESMRWIARSRR